jgi:hypothetical protein
VSALAWQTGTPAEPGLYVLDLGAGCRPLVAHWSAGSRDWRDGAVRINNVRAFCGPVPPPHRAARPERRA